MKHLNTSKVLLSILSGCAFGVFFVSCANAQPPAINIALGKSVTFDPAPNYTPTAGPGDATKLTDGKYSSASSRIWLQKDSTVGWSYIKPVVITIDLGSVQPISGVSYSTAAAVYSVTWPSMIYMATSDDNKTWHYAGDLVPLSRKNGMPPYVYDGYATFHYVTHDLHTKGRYISFGVVDLNDVMVDEIEVYKGDDAWLGQPTPGRTITSMSDLAKGAITTAFAQRRINLDIKSVRDELQKSSLPADSKSAFTARLDQDAANTEQMALLPTSFKEILPFNDSHADAFAVHGELLAAQGYKPLTVWKQHRYKWLPLLAEPSTQENPQLDFSMLRNQFRSDDLLLTNASDTLQKVTLQLKNAPQGAQNDWLQVYSVAWTDTSAGTPVADALLPVDAQDGSYTIDVPAGMTRKVWFTVDSSKVPVSAYKSTFEVNGAGQQTSVPLSLNVSKIVMGKPRTSLSMWDYTNGNGAYSITPQNRAPAIAMMLSHYVDTPWASSAALPPRPDAQDFDALGNLKTKLDFSHFDQWVAMWHGARQYYLYPYSKSKLEMDSFAGAKMGTPEFNARVGSWAKALSEHMTELGLKPQQLGILIYDEPSTPVDYATIATWAKAIRAGAPDLTLIEDPINERPDQANFQAALAEVNLLIPRLAPYKTGGEATQEFFEDYRQQGKKLWFYQCDGPPRLFSPQTYYRFQSWQAFASGAIGQGYWAFGDLGGAHTSWNEYDLQGGNGYGYAPAFIDNNTVYDSVHWDSVREGIEDNEELAMLADAIKISNDTNWKSHAQEVLDNAVSTVTATWTGNYAWQQDTNPALFDTQLQKVQDLLTKG